MSSCTSSAKRFIAGSCFRKIVLRRSLSFNCKSLSADEEKTGRSGLERNLPQSSLRDGCEKKRVDLHLSRRFGPQEIYADVKGKMTEHKDQMIFSEILNSILTEPKTSTTERPKVTESLQTLFQEGRLRDLSKNSKTKEPQLTGASAAKCAGKTSKFLEPIKRHIASLDTNSAVINYYKNVIVPRFKPHKIHLEEKNSAETPVVSSDTAPHILEYCIKVLCNEYQDLLGALHIFEYSKKHSMEYFVGACLAGPYNEIILLRWRYYRDLYSVVQLSAEMCVNAIPSNEKTIDLLSEIGSEAVRCAKSSDAKYALPLWTTRDDERLAELRRNRTRLISARRCLQYQQKYGPRFFK